MEEPKIQSTYDVENPKLAEYLSQLNPLFIQLVPRFRTVKLDEREYLHKKLKRLDERYRLEEAKLLGDRETNRQRNIKENNRRRSNKSKLEKTLGEIMDLCDAYNAEACGELISTFYERLPRELRDMTYKHLTGDNTVYVDGRSIKGQALTSIHSPRDRYYRAEYPTSRADHYCRKHYYRCEVVGPHVAHEVKEAWYRNRTFWTHVRDWEDLAQPKTTPFLDQDRFNAGLQPHNVIRKIEIKCKWDHLDPHYGECEGLINVLEYCLRAREGCNIFIRIDKSGLYRREDLDRRYDEQQLKLLQDSLDKIAPTAVRLQEHCNITPLLVCPDFHKIIFDEKVEAMVTAWKRQIVALAQASLKSGES